jgi:hypothetical protein
LTTLGLLDCLAEFVRENTKDIILEARGSETCDGERFPDNTRAANIYKMRLPDEQSILDKVPYILLQVLASEDMQEEGQNPISYCKIRIVIVTYSADYSKGAIDVLNLTERIRIALLKQRTIGGKYKLDMPVERIIYNDDQAPYFDGELMTNWFLPPIQQEVDYGFYGDREIITGKGC